MPATPSASRRPTAIPDARRAEAVITVRDADGNALADQDVVVEQARQDLAFGNIGFDLIPLANGETDPESAGIETFGGARLEGLERLASTGAASSPCAGSRTPSGSSRPRAGCASAAST
jgi:endo-1,4-beta-xylanase